MANDLDAGENLIRLFSLRFIFIRCYFFDTSVFFSEDFEKDFSSKNQGKKITATG